MTAPKTFMMESGHNMNTAGQTMPIIEQIKMGTSGISPLDFNPSYYNYSDEPMRELGLSTGAILRQEINFSAMISGDEIKKKYQVFTQSSKGLTYIFKCNQRNGCCICCCSKNCRSLEMIIRHIASEAEIITDISKIFIRAYKPCGSGCLCFCRHHMDIKLDENKEYLGKVIEPFTFCDRNAEVYDKNNNLKFTIIGDFCQFGLCSNSSSKKYREYEFDIDKSGDNGDHVGIMKKVSSTLGEYFTKVESYKITFPNDATPEDKMLIICAGLLIDNQFF